MRGRWNGQRHDHRATRLNPSKHPVLAGITVLAAAGALIAGAELWRVAVAAVVIYLILWIGTVALGSMARPKPEPLPPGEMRRVKIVYRCEICGTEVRMTVSPSEDPEPPRHCGEDMALVTPVDEF